MSLKDEMLLKNERDSVVVAMDKLREEARPNCKHCYGRGYQGREHKTGNLVVCPCVMRNSLKKMKAEEAAKNKAQDTNAQVC